MARKKRGVPRIEQLPFLWVFTTGTQAVGLCVEERADGLVWLGNDKGEVYALTKDGERTRTLVLPKGVHCLLVDDAWTYAGCNDGSVYDLTTKPAPSRVVRIAPDMNIGWIEGHRGRLCVADAEGGLSVFDVEKHLLWERRDDAAKASWMVRADDGGVFHGSEVGVRAYDWSGALVWEVGGSDVGDVRFGDLIDDHVVVTAGWVKRKQTHLHVLTKKGRLRFSVRLKAGAGGEKLTGAESCCAARDAAGNVRFYASCGGTLFCFSAVGAPLWQAPTRRGSACNMQAVGERLYVVTSDGSAACIDVSDAALERAQQGTVPELRSGTSLPTPAAKPGAP